MDNLRYILSLLAVFAAVAFLMLWSVAAHSDVPECAQPYPAALFLNDGFVVLDAFVDDAGTAWVYWYRPGQMMITFVQPDNGVQCIYLQDKDLPRRWRNT